MKRYSCGSPPGPLTVPVSMSEAPGSERMVGTLSHLTFSIQRGLGRVRRRRRGGPAVPTRTPGGAVHGRQALRACEAVAEELDVCLERLGDDGLRLRRVIVRVAFARRAVQVREPG